MNTDISAPSPGTLFLTDQDVRSVFDWQDAIGALRTAYAAESPDAMFPPRSMARGDGLWLRTMTGISPDGEVLGAKMITASIRNQVVSYLIPLFDQQTTALVGLLDGASITGFRTAATSALAADALCPAGPLHVAVIGSGFEARTHVRALAASRAIERVTVFSPNPASRERFITELADLGLGIGQAESAQGAIEGASLILCAARSRDESPTLRGAWLKPGVTVISIGSTLPEQRELDSEAIARADRIVADMPEEVAHDTGDMLAATQDGIAFADRLTGLGDVVGGRAPGRSGKDQIILYKSVGAALQDIVVAAMCLRRARAQGKGAVLPVSITPVNKGK